MFDRGSILWCERMEKVSLSGWEALRRPTGDQGSLCQTGKYCQAWDLKR